MVFFMQAKKRFAFSAISGTRRSGCRALLRLFRARMYPICFDSAERSCSQLVTFFFWSGRTGIYVMFDILHQSSYKLLFKNEDDLETFIGRSSSAVHVHEYGKQQTFHDSDPDCTITSPWSRCLGSNRAFRAAIVQESRGLARSRRAGPCTHALLCVSAGLNVCCNGAISPVGELKLQCAQTG